MVKGLLIKGKKDKVLYEGYLFSKQRRESFPKKSECRAKDLLEVIHSDLCGPMENISIIGSRYFLIFTGNFLRYTFMDFLKTKSEVLSISKTLL